MEHSVCCFFSATPSSRKHLCNIRPSSRLTANGCTMFSAKADDRTYICISNITFITFPTFFFYHLPLLSFNQSTIIRVCLILLPGSHCSRLEMAGDVPDNVPSRAHGIIVAAIVCSIFSTLFVAVRIYTRVFINRTLGWDDCMSPCLLLDEDQLTPYRCSCHYTGIPVKLSNVEQLLLTYCSKAIHHSLWGPSWHV